MDDRALPLLLSICLGVTSVILAVGFIAGWSRGAIGAAITLGLVLTAFVADPLLDRYRKRHGIDPHRRP